MKSETTLHQSCGLSPTTTYSVFRENPCEIRSILPKKIVKFTMKNTERCLFTFFAQVKIIWKKIQETLEVLESSQRVVKNALERQYNDKNIF